MIDLVARFPSNQRNDVVLFAAASRVLVTWYDANRYTLVELNDLASNDFNGLYRIVNAKALNIIH